MHLYMKSCLMHIKSRMQYPASFILLTLSGAIVPFSGLLSIYFLFERFKNLRGYSFHEVSFFFSVIFFGFSTGEMLFRGLDLFSRQIRQAGFDRFLVRPRSPILQALCSEFEFNRIGRIIVALVLVFYSINNLPIVWNAGKVFVLLLMLIGSVAVYYSVFLFGAALCFFTIEGLEVVNVLINGGEQSIRYPVSIYGRVFRFFFTFIVPMAATNYYPGLFILGRSDSILFASTPLLALVSILPSYIFWRYGIKNYKSTGNYTV